jgi:hypothetical protein
MPTDSCACLDDGPRVASAPVGRLRSSGLLALIALACVALPAAVAATPLGTTAPDGATANTTTYQDSTGENPAAPDITTIVASNNDAGLISFRINVPNRATLSADMLVAMEIDSDNNAATGSADGTDYAIELLQGDVALFKWDGENFTRRAGDPPATSLIFSYQGGATLTISAAELGNTKNLKFSAIVIAGLTTDPVTGDLDFTNATADIAPAVGAGLYAYQVKVGRATLQVRRFSTTPARPLAGKPFALRLQAARSDTGALVQGGRVTCLGRVGAARLAGTGRFVGRQAVCTFRIPATAKGKTFRGSISIVFEGLRVTRSYSRAIG